MEAVYYGTMDQAIHNPMHMAFFYHSAPFYFRGGTACDIDEFNFLMLEVFTSPFDSCQEL